MSEQEADVRLNQPHAVPYVPDFDLIRPVGSGGFGEVWLATNRTTGRLCAVKVIPLQSSGNADPAAREIGSLTRLEANSRCRHPNLLQIHHVGKTARHLFYVMDPADDVSGEPASDKPDYRPATLQTMLQGGGKGDRSNLPGRPSGCCAQIGPVPFSPQFVRSTGHRPKVGQAVPAKCACPLFPPLRPTFAWITPGNFWPVWRCCMRPAWSIAT